MKFVGMPQAVRNYQELEAAINKFQNNDWIRRDSLDYLRNILELFDNPHESIGFSCHITGTNGKGSTAWKTAKSLTELKPNCKTALFISPHIYSYCERISINNVLIQEEELVDYANEVFAILHPLSQDDLSNADNYRLGAAGFLFLVAMLYFRDKHLDYAVIEAGIGAKLDHTNVITSNVAIITSIGMDHSRLLGPTRVDIARDKAEIIKTGGIIVIGPSITEAPLNEISAKAAAMSYDSNQIIQVPYVEGRNFELDNQVIAKAALEAMLNRPLPNTKAMGTSPPARFQQLQCKFGQKLRNFIFDVGHNPFGLQAVFERYLDNHEPQNTVLLFAIMKSKDLVTCCEIINSFLPNATVILLNLSHPKFVDPVDIAAHLQQTNLKIVTPSELSQSLMTQWALLTKPTNLVIGSFITIAAVSHALNINLRASTNIHGTIGQTSSTTDLWASDSSRVNLASQNLDDNDVAHFCKNFLAKDADHKVSVLDLSGNNFTDIGLRWLAFLLMHDTSLLKINLSDNPRCTSRGYNLLIDVMRLNFNTTLQSLFISETKEALYSPKPTPFF